MDFKDDNQLFQIPNTDLHPTGETSEIRLQSVSIQQCGASTHSEASYGLEYGMATWRFCIEEYQSEARMTTSILVFFEHPTLLLLVGL
jgi:hypothetical protein